MSVLIRGMELPDNCGACPLETDYGTCGYYSLFVEAGHDSEIWKRRDDCPLVEVPPHGRLIDADEFIKEECNSCDGACESIPCDCLNCAADCRCDFMKDIADAPTIIPAEEDE